MSLEDAFHHPRIDVSGGEAVIADDSLPADTLAALAQAGQVVTTRRVPYPYAFACPAGVLREGEVNWGATEPLTPWGDAVAAAECFGAGRPAATTRTCRSPSFR